MILFKAFGKTYSRVVTQKRHAFLYRPADAQPDELVLLSKNREDCRDTEMQIQFVAKLHSIRNATPDELEKCFPGVEAGARWKFLAQMYWCRRLQRPFNLSSVLHAKSRHYNTVQDFAKILETDMLPIGAFLFRTNPILMLDMANNAEPPNSVEFPTAEALP